MPIEAQAGSTALTFSTAGELAVALDRALDEGRGYGDPIVRVGFDDSEPAWRFLDGVIATRSDWLPAIGAAVQHAVWRGDAFARQALVDFLASARRSVSLLPWTAPLAEVLAGARGRHARLTWGCDLADLTLGAVVAAHRSWRSEVDDPAWRLPLAGWRSTGRDLFELRAPADLDAAVARARRGAFVATEWGDSPAAWLHLAVLARPWVDDWTVGWVARALDGDADLRALALEWLLDGRDLWRHLPALERLRAAPPPWWGSSAHDRPAAWKRGLRLPRSDRVSQGVVAARLIARARAQAATSPVVDLPPIAFA
jgi:hypothetical protein